MIFERARGGGKFNKAFLHLEIRFFSILGGFFEVMNTERVMKPWNIFKYAQILAKIVVFFNWHNTFLGTRDLIRFVTSLMLAFIN